MSAVQDFVSIANWPTHARFPFTADPEFTLSDFPWESGVAMWSSNAGIYSDFDLQIIAPVIIRPPQNNVLFPGEDADYDDEYDEADAADGIDAGLSSILWLIGSNHDANVKFLPRWGGSTAAPLSIYVFPETFLDADEGLIELTGVINTQILTAKLSPRSQANVALGSGDAGGTSTTPDDPMETAIAVEVGTGGDISTYRVAYVGNGDYRIEYKPVGGSDYVLLQIVPRQETPGFQEQDHTKGQMDLVVGVEFRLVAGQMDIRIGNIAEPFRFDEGREGTSTWKMTTAIVTARKVVGLTIYCEEGRWLSDSTYANFTSREFDIGFRSASDPDITLIYANHDDASDGWGVTVVAASPYANLRGDRVKYELAMEGPADGTWKGREWANFAPAIRCVHFKWPRRIHHVPEAPSLDSPWGYQVSHTLNLQNLGIDTTFSVDYIANKQSVVPGGQTMHWGEWSARHGQVATDIWLSRTSPSGASGPSVQVASGYGHVLGEVVLEGGENLFRMHGRGRHISLDSPRWDLPWMDGWNFFYAVYYWAQLAGLVKEDMLFSSSIPPSAYDLSYDEDGEEAYFMPVGNQGSVLTRPSGQLLSRMIEKAAYSIGYMRFFDAEGKYECRKFRIPSGIKRQFYESDRESAYYGGIGAGLEGCWSIHRTKDHTTVRSDTMVIGVNAFNPSQDPISVAYREPSIIYDSDAFNHLGYPNPTAWIDTQFAELVYAARSAQAMHRVFRMPYLPVVFTSWLQPDIFPLDVVTVNSPKVGISSVPLVVLGVHHSGSKLGPARSTIVAQHFVPDTY